MRVYISGPMTGYPEFNFPAFRAAAARLRADGHEVEDPSAKGVIAGWAWADYLRHDLRVLSDCEAIYTLEGWEQSKGARLEMHVAKELGLTWLNQPKSE